MFESKGTQTVQITLLSKIFLLERLEDFMSHPISDVNIHEP